jgi:hypothetical protein
MATTDVAIGNLALSHLGDQATVADFSENSIQAGYLQQFYPIARATMLEMFPWKFATRRVQPALRSDLSYGSWLYVYAEPANLIKVWGALPSGYTRDDEDTVEFDTESDMNGQALILSNTPNMWIRGTFLVTDPAKFTPLFVEALAWLVASYVAGPLIKGDTGASEGVRCYQAFLAMFGRASASSANQRKKRIEHIPDWIDVRGATHLRDLTTR